MTAVDVEVEVQDALPVWELLGMANPHNARRMDGEKIDRLAASIRDDGWLGGSMVVNRRSVEKGWPEGSRPMMVSGHQRTRAAHLAGLAELPVRWVDVAQATEERLLLQLNRLQGDDDERSLALILARLDEDERKAAGFDDAELRRLVKADLVDPGLDALEEPADSLVERFGGATQVERSSVPMRYWADAGLMVYSTRWLDFGCGKEPSMADGRYDPFTAPDPAPLLERWGLITCNYVLNVQPADHLVVQLAALLRALLEPDGQVLFAVLTDKAHAGKPAMGGREPKGTYEWLGLLTPFFDCQVACESPFLGIVASPK